MVEHGRGYKRHDSDGAGNIFGNLEPHDRRDNYRSWICAVFANCSQRTQAHSREKPIMPCALYSTAHFRWASYLETDHWTVDNFPLCTVDDSHCEHVDDFPLWTVDDLNITDDLSVNKCWMVNGYVVFFFLLFGVHHANECWEFQSKHYLVITYFDEIERMIKVKLFKRDLFYIASGLK